MSTKLKVFLLSTPLVLLFGLGILFRTAGVTYSASGCTSENLSGNFQDDLYAIYQGKNILVPSAAFAKAEDNPVLGAASSSDKWIEIDLSEQKLRAWDGNNLFLETLVSTGLPGTPTPTGEFRIWVKLRATRMEGGEGSYYYNLPNVPYVMFFENDNVPGWEGYGLHGTYWHNDFGTPHSHGCVNLPTSIAERIYYWATPSLPEDKSSIFANAENPGTRIVIHE